MPLVCSSSLILLCAAVTSRSPQSPTTASTSAKWSSRSDPTQKQAFNAPLGDVSSGQSSHGTDRGVGLDDVENLKLQTLNDSVQAYFELCVDRSKFRTSLGEICFNNDQGVRIVRTDFQLFGECSLCGDNMKALHPIELTPVRSCNSNSTNVR